MEEKLKLILCFTVIYLLIFTVLSVINRNYEFIYYIIVMSLLVLFIVLYYKKLHLHIGIISGLTITGIFHLMGGNIFLKGVRLYDVWLIDNVFRYDHFVHFVGVFVATIIAYNLLYPYLDRKLMHNNFLLSMILILIASGIGALNEVLELGAVVFIGSGDGVGGYMNNALDLLFNFLGAVAACFYIIHYHKHN